VRIVCATIVLGATVAGNVWVYTYREWNVIEYIDPLGRHFHPSQRVREQPWWSAPAAVALVVIGAAIVVRLLPERRRLIRGFADHFAKAPGVRFNRLYLPFRSRNRS
jgi:hypothetical protein